MTTNDSNITHKDWLNVQIKPNEFFQLKNFERECRIVKVLTDGKYEVTQRASADRWKSRPALAAVTNGVLTIGGTMEESVSFFDTQNNTWRSDLAKLN